MPSSLSHLDRPLASSAAALEGAVRGAHRRRLARLGWDHVWQPGPWPWVAGDPQPRSGNAVDVLIDGEEAFAALVEEISRARSHVHLTAWRLTLSFLLTREGPPVTLLDLLAGVANRVEVRVMIWQGAPLPVVRPWRADALLACRRLRQAGVRCVLDRTDRLTGTAHDKVVVVDDRVAFVNGIDPTELPVDRFDSRDHPPRGGMGWHDLGVRLRGPIVEDVAAHFGRRWETATGEELTSPQRSEPEGGVRAQLVDTVPEGRYSGLPRGSFRVLDAYLDALRRARRLIYVETEFLWSSEVVALLADRLRRPPCEEFRVVLVLPLSPLAGFDRTRGQLAILDEADGAAGRLLACTVHAHGTAGSFPIYVHSKVCIVDDDWMTVGSANLNDNSLFRATEANIVVADNELVRQTRERLWSEHLELPASEVTADPLRTLEDLWRPLAEEGSERRRRGESPRARLSFLPHASGGFGRLVGSVQNLLLGT